MKQAPLWAVLGLLLSAYRLPSGDIQKMGATLDGNSVVVGNAQTAQTAANANNANNANNAVNAVNVVQGGNVTTNIVTALKLIAPSFISNGNSVFIGVTSNPNAVMVALYNDQAFGEVQYGFATPARLGTNPANFNSGILGLGGLDANHVGLMGQAPNPNGPVGFTGGTLALRSADGGATNSPAINVAAVYIPNAGPVHVQNGGSASNPPFQICSTLNAAGNAWLGCNGFHSSGGALVLDTNGLAALAFDTSTNATFSGTVAGTFFKSTGGQGAFQSGSTTATFANIGSTYGMFITPTALVLKTNNIAALSFDASQNATFPASVNAAQYNATYFGVGGGALTFNGSGAAVPQLAASLYTPTTTQLNVALAGNVMATMTPTLTTFNAQTAVPTLRLLNGAIVSDGNITTPVSTLVNGEIFSSTTALFGTASTGYQFWLNGPGTTLYITNGVGGSTVSLNTGSIVSHGTYITTGVTGNMFVTASGYGLGAANAAVVSMYAGGTPALTFDSTQNATLAATLAGHRRVTTSKTGAYTLATGITGDSGKSFNNSTATASVPFTLPACTASTLGFNTRFSNLTTFGYTVTTNGTDTAILGGVTGSTKTVITTTAQGSYLELECEVAGQWNGRYSGTFTSN